MKPYKWLTNSVSDFYSNPWQHCKFQQQQVSTGLSVFFCSVDLSEFMNKRGLCDSESSPKKEKILGHLTWTLSDGHIAVILNWRQQIKSLHPFSMEPGFWFGSWGSLIPADKHSHWVGHHLWLDQPMIREQRLSSFKMSWSKWCSVPPAPFWIRMLSFILNPLATFRHMLQ